MNGLEGPAVTELRAIPDGIRIKLGRMWSAGPSGLVNLMTVSFFTRRGFPGVIQCLNYSQCRNLYSKALPGAPAVKQERREGFTAGAPGRAYENPRESLRRSRESRDGIIYGFKQNQRLSFNHLRKPAGKLAVEDGDVNSMRRLEGCLQEARQPIASLPSAEPAVIYVLKKRTGFTVLGLQCQHKQPLLRTTCNRKSLLRILLLFLSNITRKGKHGRPVGSGRRRHRH